jgi:hypothetical protein
MCGYQSDIKGGGTILFRNKGFLFVAENRPFPIGIKGDFYIVDGAGAVGAVFPGGNGDLLLCIEDNPGGNGLNYGWMIVPRAPDFVEEFGEGGA